MEECWSEQRRRNAHQKADCTSMHVHPDYTTTSAYKTGVAEKLILKLSCMVGHHVISTKASLHPAQKAHTYLRLTASVMYKSSFSIVSFNSIDDRFCLVLKRVGTSQLRGWLVDWPTGRSTRRWLWANVVGSWCSCKRLFVVVNHIGLCRQHSAYRCTFRCLVRTVHCRTLASTSLWHQGACRSTILQAFIKAFVASLEWPNAKCAPPSAASVFKAWVFKAWSYCSLNKVAEQKSDLQDNTLEHIKNTFIACQV